MAKPKDNRKPVFTVLGSVVFEGGKKRIKINSPEHYHNEIQQLVVGKAVGITIEEYKASRSATQLAYHWVLMGYLARHTGHTTEELHDTLMRAKFGTKTVRVGPIEQEVRRSISNAARFPTSDMVELIEFDLQLCADLEVTVPTREELGYLPN